MRRAIIVVLLPLLVLSWLGAGFMRGDVSGDGRVDLADAILSMKNLAAAATDGDSSRLLRASLGSAIDAFKAIAGLAPQLRDSAKKSEISKVESSLLALIPRLETKPYHPVTSLVLIQCSPFDAVILDLLTPPPELA